MANRDEGSDQSMKALREAITSVDQKLDILITKIRHLSTAIGDK